MFKCRFCSREVFMTCTCDRSRENDKMWDKGKRIQLKRDKKKNG